MTSPLALALARLVGQVVAPAEPGAELVKLALNAGITGIFGLYVYYNNRSQAVEASKRDDRYKELVDRVEKMEARRIEDDRIARHELIGTLKEMQADNRDRSDKDRTLVKDVVQVMVEVKKVVESQEVTVRALDATIRTLQMEFQSFRANVGVSRSARKESP